MCLLKVGLQDLLGFPHGCCYCLETSILLTYQEWGMSNLRDWRSTYAGERRRLLEMEMWKFEWEHELYKERMKKWDPRTDREGWFTLTGGEIPPLSVHYMHLARHRSMWTSNGFFESYNSIWYMLDCFANVIRVIWSNYDKSLYSDSAEINFPSLGV